MSEGMQISFGQCFTDGGQPCNALLTVRHDPWQWPQGQLLRNGEPAAVLDEETGLWECEYPFIFVPGPVTAWCSFGDEAGYTAFVQEVA